jgi:hypothetical protein
MISSMADRVVHLALHAVAMILLAGCLAPVAAQKPTLGEVARKEQERRKTTKGTPKVLTSKDLPASKPPATPPAGGAQPPAAAPEQKPGEGQKPPGEQQAGEQKDEAWWRDRIMQARESLRRSEAFLEALQSRVNALSTDFVNRDDPYQRAKIGEDRQKALIEMDRVRAEITMFKKQIEDIEEEARKAGVPPGWLR